MSITDELREFIDSLACHKDTRDMMRRIADRIDERHREECEERYAAGVESVPIALDMSQYVKLPVDADGVPIHLGDMVGWDGDGEFEVKGFGGSRAERLFYLNENGRFCWGIAENCRHVQPDSWECIISDAVILGRQLEWLDNSRGDADSERELVERCRRLADGRV